MKKRYTSLLALILTGNIAFAQPDMGVTEITTPTPGSSILTTYNDTLAFKIKNFGDSLNIGDSLVITMFIDGVEAPGGYFLIMQQAWPTNDEYVLAGPVDFTSLNISAGSHTICLTTDDADDVNHANDTACATYTFTVPTGIGLTLGSKSSIFLNNGILNLNITHSDIVESTTLTVYNMAGRLVYAEDIGGNGSISSTVDLSSYATGVYVVRLVSKGRLIDTRKLIK